MTLKDYPRQRFSLRRTPAEIDKALDALKEQKADS
jgi:hypothetical protein